MYEVLVVWTGVLFATWVIHLTWDPANKKEACDEEEACMAGLPQGKKKEIKIKVSIATDEADATRL